MKSIIAALTLFSLSLAVWASHNTEDSVEARIGPVGTLNVMSAEEMAAKANAASTEVAAAGEESGESVYQSACFACHGTGAAGAPKVGDAAAWTERLAQGMETLINNAINGIQGSAGVMPARGGNPNLSDEAVTAAVEFMLENSQ